MADIAHSTRLSKSELAVYTVEAAAPSERQQLQQLEAFHSSTSYSYSSSASPTSPAYASPTSPYSASASAAAKKPPILFRTFLLNFSFASWSATNRFTCTKWNRLECFKRFFDKVKSVYFSYYLQTVRQELVLVNRDNLTSEEGIIDKMKRATSLKKVLSMSNVVIDELENSDSNGSQEQSQHDDIIHNIFLQFLEEYAVFECNFFHIEKQFHPFQSYINKHAMESNKKSNFSDFDPMLEVDIILMRKILVEYFQGCFQLLNLANEHDTFGNFTNFQGFHTDQFPLEGYEFIIKLQMIGDMSITNPLASEQFRNSKNRNSQQVDIDLISMVDPLTAPVGTTIVCLYLLSPNNATDHKSWKSLQGVDWCSETFRQFQKRLSNSTGSVWTTPGHNFCFQSHHNEIPTLKWCRYFELPIRHQFNVELQLCDRFIFTFQHCLLEILVRYPINVHHPNAVSIGVIDSSSVIHPTNLSKFYLEMFEVYVKRKSCVFRAFHNDGLLSPKRLIAFPQSVVGFQLKLLKNLIILKDYNMTSEDDAHAIDHLRYKYCDLLYKSNPVAMQLNFKWCEYQLALPPIVSIYFPTADHYQHEFSKGNNTLLNFEDNINCLVLWKPFHNDLNRKGVSKKTSLPNLVCHNNVNLDVPLTDIFGEKLDVLTARGTGSADAYVACFCVSTTGNFVAAAFVGGLVKVRCISNLQTFVNKKQTNQCPFPTAIALRCDSDNTENFVVVGAASGHVLLFIFNDFTGGELLLVNAIQVPLCLEKPKDWITVLHIYDVNNIVIGLETGKLLNWFGKNRVGERALNFDWHCSDSDLHCGCNVCLGKPDEFNVTGLSIFKSDKSFHKERVSSSVVLKKKITCIDANRTRGVIAVGSLNRRVTLWLVGKDLKRNGFLCTTRKLMELSDHRSGISCVVCSLSGGVVYAGEYDGSIAVWDAIMGVKLRTIHDAYRLPCQLFKPREFDVAVSDPSSLLFEADVDHDQRRIKSLTLSNDGGLMIAAFASGHIIFLDAHVVSGSLDDNDIRCTQHYDLRLHPSDDQLHNTSFILKDHFEDSTRTIPAAQDIHSRNLILQSNYYFFQGWESKINDIVVLREFCLVARHQSIQVINLRDSSIRVFEVLDNPQKAGLAWRWKDQQVGLMAARTKNEVFAIYNKNVFQFQFLDLNQLSDDASSRLVLSSPCLEECEESKRYGVYPICAYAIEKVHGAVMAIARKCRVSHSKHKYVVQCYFARSHGIYALRGQWIMPEDAGFVTSLAVLCMDQGLYFVIAGTKSGGVFSLRVEEESNPPAETQSKQIVTVQVSTPLYSHLKTVNSIAVEDKIVFSGGNDTQVIVWDFVKNTLVYKLNHEEEVTCVVVCPITSLLLVGCTADSMYVWYWSTCERLGIIRQSDLRRSDCVSAIGFSECEQVYLTTASDERRLRIHRHMMTDDFHRIHNLAIMKKRGHTTNFARLPVNISAVLTHIENKDFSIVAAFCKSNPREARELLLLLGKCSFYDDNPASSNSANPAESHLTALMGNNEEQTVLRNFHLLSDLHIKELVEVLPHLIFLKMSKYGNFIDTLLALKKHDHISLSNGFIGLLLNTYSFLLGARPRDVNLDIDESYWEQSCKKTFYPYIDNSVDAAAQPDFARPLCDHIDINKVIDLCAEQQGLFAKFVKNLKPVRNYDAMLPVDRFQRIRIPHTENYYLRGSSDCIVCNFWVQDSRNIDATASDVVVPMYIPVRNIAARQSTFLVTVVGYTEACGDYSLLRNSVVQLVIDFKWRKNVKKRFQIDFIILLIWHFFIVLLALLNRHKDRQHHLQTTIGLRIVVIILLCRFLFKEALEFGFRCYRSYLELDSDENSRSRSMWRKTSIAFGRGVIRYWSRYENWADGATCIGLIIALELQRQELTNDIFMKSANDAFAILLPLMSLNVLFYLRGWEYVGSNISMMFVMIKSSLSLLLILALLIMCFAASFMLTCTNKFDFQLFNTALVAVYSYLFGYFDFHEMYTSSSPKLAVILLIIFLFIASIILLNLLIAIMGSSQEKMNELVDEAVMLSRAQLIEEYENSTVRWGLNKPRKVQEFPQWDVHFDEELPVNDGASGRALHRSIPHHEVESKIVYVNNEPLIAEPGLSANNRIDGLLLGTSAKVNNHNHLSYAQHSKGSREPSVSSVDNNTTKSWLNDVVRWLIFLMFSVTVLDEKQELELFPRYIQILMKDGFSFDNKTLENKLDSTAST